MHHRTGSKILSIIIFLSLSLGTNAQTRFNSEKIRQVFASMPQLIKTEIAQKSNYKTGSYLLPVNQFGPYKNITFRINRYNELDHIGLLLFSDQQNSLPIREVFDYIERSFLVSAMLKEKILLERESRENGIEVKYNGAVLKPQNSLSILPQIVIDPTTPLTIKYNTDNFILMWRDIKSNEITIKIPNEYSVISGKTKDELEKQLMRDLLSSQDIQIEKIRPQRNQLKQAGQNLFLLEGEIYSTTPELSSTKYFQINDSIYPVFNMQNYKESIRNLFLNQISSSIDLSLTQKQYGGIDVSSKININKFLTYFKNDYTIYFGWQSSERENMKASIFLSNKVYNFNHLLVVKPNIKTVFRKYGEVEGLFFAYIPKENTKNKKE